MLLKCICNKCPNYYISDSYYEWCYTEEDIIGADRVCPIERIIIEQEIQLNKLLNLRKLIEEEQGGVK